MRLQFTVPNEEPAADAWTLLERAWPEGTEAQRRQVFEDAQFTMDGRITRNPERSLDTGAEIVVEVPVGEEPFGLPSSSDLGRGDGWVIVDKTVGMPGTLDRDNPMNPVLFLADMLGFDRDTIEPVWPLPTNMGGPWLIALDEASATRLRGRLSQGDIMNTWSAIVPTPRVSRGFFEFRGVHIEYGCARIQDGLAEVQLTPDFTGTDDIDPVEFLLDLLADNHIPVVGDRERNGIMAAGSCRLRLTALYDQGGDLAHSWNTPDWWPEGVSLEGEEVIEVTTEKAGLPTLQISRKTLDILSLGHPWVLADRDTGNRASMKPGMLVQLQTPEGKNGPFALIEGPDKLAARIFSKSADDVRNFRDEIETRLDIAIANRTKLQAQSDQTDLYRRVHAEADGLPGIEIDRVGPVLRATITGGAALGFRSIIYDSLADFDPDMVILEVEHMRDIREGKKLPQAKVVKGRARYVKAGDRLIGREHGLRYYLEPWEGIDTGFFADQRDNRLKLASLAKPDQKWLNLFCHTGAFSVALIAKGAHVVSNDLSKRYLDWLDDNLKLNGLDRAMNENIVDDARNYLQSTQELFDGVIVDPPTAASGEDGFWSVRKGYGTLLEQCFKVLKPGGMMLVCRNDRKRSGDLDELIQEAAAAQGCKIRKIEDAPPSMDYPELEGFPEGNSFEGRLVFTR